MNWLIILVLLTLFVGVALIFVGSYLSELTPLQKTVLLAVGGTTTFFSVVIWTGTRF